MSKVTKLNTWFTEKFSQKRIFIKSADNTIYLTIKPYQQISAILFLLTIGIWLIISVSYIAIDSNYSQNEVPNFDKNSIELQERLNRLALERDIQITNAISAKKHFQSALTELAKNQTEILNSKIRAQELETAVSALQEMLVIPSDNFKQSTRKTINSISKNTDLAPEDAQLIVNFLANALERNAEKRLEVNKENSELKSTIRNLEHKALVSTERTQRIFSRLEEAVNVSVAPLERMFEDVGISTKKLLQDVRRGYSGIGGPLMPLKVSKKHSQDSHINFRANEILSNLDTLNLYRIAAFQTPFSHPLKATHRFTSGFGIRKDPFTGKKQMHSGIDLAAYSGSKIHATADGVVTKAWPNGAYGKLIEIRHTLGYSTRYAHLKKIRVKSGQRVARGDIIGDMGNTGRSTGTHLHYEIRKNGKAINPMTYIKAARNVF